jgi:Calx-beta domain
VSTSNGTATAPTDYVDLVNGAGTIPAGSTSTQIGVTINGDTRFELAENLFVIIDTPTNAVLGNSVAEINLTNDDPIIIGLL